MKIVDEILLSVQKPARYTGGELNMVKKDLRDISARFAFCFPDIYEVGMSHLGLRILYDIINKIEGAYCERAFAPWDDMEAAIRENNISLFSLETGTPLKAFDFLGFTLQYELSYTNVLNMLDLSGIPLLAADRTDDDPLVIAGGPCAYDPEPLADFIDFFVIGEAEEAIVEILAAYMEHKAAGKGRRSFLDAVYDIEGVYVPSGMKKTVRKRLIKDLDAAPFPEKPLVPHLQIIHDRAVLELFRGCIRGCRFCQAGYTSRPAREKSPDKLHSQANQLICATGYEELSLNSLSTSDYSEIEKLTAKLVPLVKEKRVSLSLPSLRVDSFSLDLLEKVQNDRKSGLTFAPEAGTPRLRAVINKGITEEDILNSAGMAFARGYRTIKLYFMLGLPSETDEDIEGIALLADKIMDKFVETTGKRNGLMLNISTALFVPKPFTPFQWEPQDSIEEYRRKTSYLKHRLNKRFIKYSYHDADTAFLEAVFARGDRALGRALLSAFRKGCRLDAWNEHFKFNSWMEAFRETGIDPEYYATRRRSRDEQLPWDFIDAGLSVEFLASENEKAMRAEETINCRDGCAECGLFGEGAGVCVK